MAQVLIRNVPDDTIESYKERARLKGRSLEQELRELLERNKPFTPDERLAMARMIRARAKGVAPSLSLDEVREGLE
jgi:plasmid stability protein